MKVHGARLAVLLVGVYFLSLYASTTEAFMPKNANLSEPLVILSNPTLVDIGANLGATSPDDGICPLVCFPDGTCGCDTMSGNNKGGKYKLLCSDVVSCDDGNPGTLDGCTNTKSGAQCFHLSPGV